jgi:quercetin dioxygenase-like cupin family protein
VIVSRSQYRFRPLPGRESADPLEGVPAGGVSVRIVQLESGRARTPHRHPHSREAIYVVSGHGRLWEDGVVHKVEAGDFALIEAGTPHAAIPDPDTSMKLVCFFPCDDLNANIEELEDVVINETPEGDAP